MKLVGAGLGNLIHDAAGSAAIFRVVIVGKNFEFFLRVGIGADHDIVAKKVGIVSPVQKRRLAKIPTAKNPDPAKANRGSPVHLPLCPAPPWWYPLAPPAPSLPRSATIRP